MAVTVLNHLSVKHLEKKFFTEITKALRKINSNMSWKAEFKINQLNAIVNWKGFCGYTKWERPFRKKFLKASYDPYMTKRPRKAIMKRSELKSKYLTIQSDKEIKSEFLSDKGSQCLQVNLADQDNVISDDKNLSKEFSNFFDTAVKKLNVKGPLMSHVNDYSDLTDIF